MLTLMAKKKKFIPPKLSDLDVELVDVTLPQDFKQALERNPEAKHFFDTLPRSDKHHVVVSIEAAKSAETRQRCIAKAISHLHQGRM